MSRRRLGLTGPPAAALAGLDGFRNLTWPGLWAAPTSGTSNERIIRVTRWEEPIWLGDQLVCPIPLVLRHLNAVPADLLNQPDGITPRDRVELAVEHALREGHKVTAGRGGASPGDRMLREVLRLRGDEPPTESYAETRAVQLFRSFGITPWRQVPVSDLGRRSFRADFMVPFSSRRRRPEVFRPHDGVLVEVDSEEHHAHNLEHDVRRDTTYTALGFTSVWFTPNQIEHDTGFVRRSLLAVVGRAA